MQKVTAAILSVPMAQHCLTTSLTRETSVIAEEAESESDSLQSFAQEQHSRPTQTTYETRAPLDKLCKLQTGVEVGKLDAGGALANSMLSKQGAGEYGNMESNKPLLLDSEDSLYSNGAVQLSTFIGSGDNLTDDRLINPPCDTTAVSADLKNCDANDFITNPIPTSSVSSPVNAEIRERLNDSELRCASAHPSPVAGAHSYQRTHADAVRNRQRFANRSISTDNPLIRRNRGLNSRTPPLNRLGSASGPLLRANSFEKGTQTAPYTGGRVGSISSALFDRLTTETRNSSRYDSKSLSNLGVECMKASGALAISFKQLQKPSPVRNDTASDLSRHISYESKSNSERNASAIGAEVRTVVHMRDKAHANSQPSHVIKVENAEEEPEIVPQHHHIGYRLGQRKLLAEQRRKIADLCCLSALLGLVLMIVETECNIAEVYTKADVPSYVVKGLITLSTLVLLVLIGLYHAVEVKLFVVDNCIEDWRIAMSWVRVVQIGAELIICSIHPPPGTCTFPWYVRSIKTLEWKKADVPLDIIFSLPMFARLYLIIRVLLLHSKLFTDASSRSIGALNKITFNTRFVLKTLMTIFPGTVMGVFMLSLWIICAWTYRACENFHDPLFKNFLNTLYMVAITFLSVGYGDFVPHTYCGRTISVISGLMGAGCTALVVAVIARKLELTRAEKHVHNFMLESQLNKKLKDAAANVLRETWLIYKYTRIVKRVNGRKVRAHQRKFLHAIQLLRLVKLKQRKLADQANSLTDFAKTTAQVHDIVGDLRGAQENSNHRIKNIERSLQNLQAQIDALPQAVAQIIAEKQASTSSFLSANDASIQESPRERRDAACMSLPKPISSTQSSFESCG